MSDIRQWLEELGLGRYADAFEENEIEPEVLSELTDGALKELGVSVMGHRLKLLKAVTASKPTTRDSAGTDELSARPAPSAPEAERRQITVMFCDLATAWKPLNGPRYELHPSIPSPSQPDRGPTTAYRDSSGPDSRSEAHCATFVADQEEPSGEPRLRWRIG